MRSSRRWASALVAFWISGCGSGGPIVLLSEIPAEARSLVIAIEQGEHQLVEARDAADSPTALLASNPISDDAPARLTLVTLRETLAEMGASASGPLAPAVGRTRPLASFDPLAVEAVTLFDGNGSEGLSPTELDPWLAQFPIADVPRCPTIDSEFVVDTGGVLDAISVTPDLAVASSPRVVVLLEPGGLHSEVPLPRGETGQGIGSSREGVVWVITSSRAVVFDPAARAFTRSVPLPRPGTFRGIYDDEASGRLYLVSTDIEIWELEHSTGTWTQTYAMPNEHIRREEVPKVPARIIPHAEPGRFLLAMEEVAAVLDYTREAPRLFTGERTGSGFSAERIPESDEVLVAEYFAGDLYRFDGTTWSSAGQGPTQITDLAPLEPERFMFITRWAVTGIVDLDNPRSCPEVPLVNWTAGRSILRTGDDFWVGLETNSNQRGWARVRVRFD